jgi:hypothetical protein
VHAIGINTPCHLGNVLELSDRPCRQIVRRQSRQVEGALAPLIGRGAANWTAHGLPRVLSGERAVDRSSRVDHRAGRPACHASDLRLARPSMAVGGARVPQGG